MNSIWALVDAHLVGRPLGQGVVDGRVEPEKDTFAFGHGIRQE